MKAIHTIKKTLAVLVVSVLAAAPAVSGADEPEWAQDIRQIQVFLDLMQNYYALIDSVHRTSSDAEASAIQQLFKIEEIYKDRGERAKAVAVFREVLAETRNPAIRNATYMMMGEALKESGRADEAIDVLREALSENIDAAER